MGHIGQCGSEKLNDVQHNFAQNHPEWEVPRNMKTGKPPILSVEVQTAYWCLHFVGPTVLCSSAPSITPSPKWKQRWIIQARNGWSILLLHQPVETTSIKNLSGWVFSPAMGYFLSFWHFISSYFWLELLQGSCWISHSHTQNDLNEDMTFSYYSL